MDYSTEAETQQHQLFLLQQQQDQQQQYDPSQVQPLSYDQTAQAYYPYYPNAHHQYAPQPYPYYQPDYSNASTVQNAYQQQHPPAENLQPPGISAPPEAAPPSAGAAQQNAYYLPEHGAYQVPHVLNPAAAAAVAALSELQHNMDAAERAERAMAAGMHERHHWPPRNGGYPPMSGPPPPFHHVGPFRPPVARPYRGGGGRSGRPYRGGGRNNYGLHPHKSDSFRGRGRMARGGGSGGGRRFHPSGSVALHHEPGAEPPAGAASEEVPIAQRPVPAAPSRQMPQVSWCELCMVDCNSLEILEQHLNGKRHKKNVQRLQEFEKHKKMMAELQQKSGVPLQQGQTQPQQEQTDTHPQQQEAHPHEIESQQQQSEPQPQQQTETLPEHQEQQAQSQQQESQPQLQSESEFLPEKEVQTGAEEQESKQISATPETFPHPTNEKMTKMETEGKQQNQPGEQPIAEVSTAPTRRPMQGRGHWDDRRRVPKRGRMMRFVRGAKRMRMSERMMDEQFPIEAKEPKVEPKFCSLCNVTCDTQAVFECHLAGKKHNSRVKRTQGSFGAYGLHSNHASHTQPAGYVPRGYHQPIIYSHPGQEITRQQPVVESESITEATSDSHGEKKSQPFQRQEVIVGSGSQEAHTIQPEGQSSQHSSTVEPNGRFSVSEPKITEARPFDFGAPPVENVVLPDLETKAAEIVLNSKG